MEEKWLFAGFDGNYFFALGDFLFRGWFFLELPQFLQLTYKITASARVIVSLFKFISFWF
jgi:hypothetical protein